MRTCRFCQKQCKLTSHGYLAHHLDAFGATCPGSQTHGWVEEKS